MQLWPQECYGSHSLLFGLLLRPWAPIGYREDLTSDFRGARDLENRSRMRALLVQE